MDIRRTIVLRSAHEQRSARKALNILVQIASINSQVYEPYVWGAWRAIVIWLHHCHIIQWMASILS